MRTSGSLKSLIHGITTDKAKLADPRHLKDQKNMQTVEGSGLHKRPPIDTRAAPLYTWELGAFNETAKDFKWEGTDYAYHVVWDVTEPTEQFTKYISDWDGNQALNFEEDDYLDGIRGPEDWDIINREGRNWVLNKKMPVAMLPDLKTTEKTSMIHVMSPPATDSSFTVSWRDINNVAWSSTILCGTAINARGTNVVAAQIATAINAELGDAGVTAYSAGSTVAVTRTDSDYANVSVQDEEAGNVLVAINGHISDINHLPRWVAGEQVLKVQPEKTSDRGVYYMESIADDTATPPTVPASDGELFGGIHFYNPNPDRYYTGVATTSSGIANYGSWTTKPTIAGAAVENFSFSTNENGTGKHYLIVSTNEPAFGGNGWPSGTFGRITVRRKSDLAVVYDESISTADELAFGTGFIIRKEIATPVNINADDFFVYFNKTTAAVSVLKEVNWIESTAPGEAYKLDPKTLPHELWWNEDHPFAASFELTAHEWEPRRAGDNSTNPLPAFVGKPIADIAVYQNRIVALVEDEIATTETAKDETISWFRNTVTQKLATHPVRLRSTAQGTGNFKSAVNHNKDLLLFTDGAMFRLSGAIPLTPDTAGLPVTLEQVSDQSIKPVSIGENVFYAFDYGDYYGVGRIIPDPADADKDTAIPITDHCKTYITGTPFEFLGDANTGELYMVMTDGKIYVCDYDVRNTRAEDRRFAWSLWHNFGQMDGTRDYTVRAVSSTGRKINLLMEANGVIMYCELDTVEDPDATAKRVYLDYNMTGVVSGSSTLTLDTFYPYNDTLELVVSDQAHDEYGNRVDYVHSGGTGSPPLTVGGTLTVDAAYNGVQMTWGYPFRASMKPNTIYIRDEGGFINSYSNFRIQKWLAHVNKTAELFGKIISNYYNLADQFWSGLISGDVFSETDEVAENTSTVHFSYKQRVDLADFELYSTSHLPWSLTQLEWLGNYTSRGRRF